MEALLPPAPAPSHVDVLLELRVPQHDPGVVSSSQPHEICAPAELEPSSDIISKIPSVSTHPVTSVDSAYSSLHNDDSQKATAQAGPSRSTGILQQEQHREETPQTQGGGTISGASKQKDNNEPNCHVTFGDDIIQITTSGTSHSKSQQENVQGNNETIPQTSEASQKSAQIPAPTEQHPSSLSGLPSESRAESSNNIQGHHATNTTLFGIITPQIQNDPAPSTQIKNKLLFWKRFRIPRSKNAAGKQPIVTTQPPPSTVSHTPNQQLPAPTPQSIHTRTSGSSKPIPVTGHADVAELDNTSANVASNTENNTANIFVESKDVSVSSPDIYLAEDGLYVGKLKELSPSATADMVWITTVRSRLITDLRPVLASLPKSLPRYGTAVELELCMAGRKISGSTTICLKPMIWVRCGSNTCRRAVRGALEDLSYLHNFPYHVSLDAPRFAAGSASRTSEILFRRAESRALSTGALAGIVVGVVFGIVFALCALFYFWRRGRRKAIMRADQSPLYTSPFHTTPESYKSYTGNYPAARPPVPEQEIGPDDSVSMISPPQRIYPQQQMNWQPTQLPRPHELYSPPRGGVYYPDLPTEFSPQPTLVGSAQPTLLASPQSTLINTPPSTLLKTPQSTKLNAPYQEHLLPPSAAEIYAPVHVHDDSQRQRIEIDAPIVEVDSPAADLVTLAAEIDTPGVKIETPATEIETPGTEINASVAELPGLPEQESLRTVYRVSPERKFSTAREQYEAEFKKRRGSRKSRETDAVSTCGVKIDFKLLTGNRQFHAVCTIGGVIRVQGDLYALTTAHGMWENDSPYPDRHPQQDDKFCVVCNFLGVDFGADKLSSHNPALKLMSLEKLAYPWLCNRGVPHSNHQKAQVKEIDGADFALLKFSTTRGIKNSYKTSDSEFIIRRVQFASSEPGPISIICSETDVRSGDLLRGSAVWMDRTGVWDTRKVYCNPPLKVGSSGAWVVRDDTLLGVVVATYDTSPYIHMLSIDKMFDDIRSVVAGDGDPSQVNVSLL